MSEARASAKKATPAPLALEVDAQAFAVALAQAARGCKSHTAVEILRGVKIEASADTLTLTGTDMETTLRVAVPASVTVPGTAVLAQASQACKVLKGLSGTLAVSFEQDSYAGALVVVAWTGATYRFPALDVSDFPALPVLDGATGTVETAALLGVLGRVLPVVSRDDSRPVLCGVRLSLGGDGGGSDDGSVLRAVATDSYRLAVDESVGVCVGPGAIEQTVPGRALGELVRLAKRKGAPSEITWAASVSEPERDPDYLGFTVGAVELIARKVDGQYLNYRQLRPDSFEVEHEIVASELIGAAKRLSAFGVRHPVIRLVVDAGTGAVTLTTTGEAYTEASETLPTAATIVGGDPKGKRPAEPIPPIGFNGDFLADAAAFCGETVRLRLLSPLRPAVFLNGREGPFHLLMPIKLAS